MSEISAKVLGVLAAVLIFGFIIAGTVFSAMDDKGSEVGTELQNVTISR